MPKVSVSQTMQDIVYLKNQIDGLNMLLSQKKQVMAKFFDKTGKKRAESDECILYVKETPNIKYDMDKIRKKLPPELCTKFIDTTYSIVGFKEFKAFCKRYGITPEQLKPFISVERKVNSDKINVLYSKGEIALSDLEGCYTAEIKKSIALRMKNVEREIPITTPN